jgi:AbrB family looped-hinge helix DNA binding protein
MMRKHQFYGTATVGERGQIVLPVKLRKAFDIKKGDKLLVIGHAHTMNVVLFKADAIDEYLEAMTEDIEHIRSELRKRGG